jgi:hypothetical protein
MSGVPLPSIAEVAAVAGWPGSRSLFRPGWTSFSGDRVSVYHRLADVDEGPAIEVTTYVDGHWIGRDTAEFMLGQLRVFRGPPRETRAVIAVDGSAVQWSVLQSNLAWVAVSEDLDPVITIVAREFPLGAVFLERVALSSLDGFDRLTASAAQ